MEAREIPVRGRSEGSRAQLIIAPMLAIYVALAAAAFCGEGKAAERKLNRDQAREVVMTFFRSQGYQIDTPVFGLEEEPDAAGSAEFLMFRAYFDTAALFNDQEAYAVSRTTLALWDRDCCEQLTSKELAHLQKRLRRKLRLADSVGRGRAAKPCSEG